MSDDLTREEVSALLREAVEHHIIAEWICCEPVDPKHHLCVQGFSALGMAVSLVADADPEEAWNPEAPLLSLVLKLMDDRAHAEADKIRKEAEETAAAGWNHDQVNRALRASGAMHYVADLIDPYEMRDDQLVRKADGQPVEQKEGA
jgi:hypothetical protein